jgi:hypothetical protein
MSKSLPLRPDLDQLKHQAKDLQRAARQGDVQALHRVREFYSREAEEVAGRSPAISLAEAQFVLAREYGFASWQALAAHVEAVRAGFEDPHEQIRSAFADDDAPRLQALLAQFPEFKKHLNEPVGPFKLTAIHQARSRAMLDALLEAGADINAKSQWWAGGFGLLHTAPPELAAYAIERGAIVDVHAAARLGKLDTLRELLARDPSLVHARGGDGQTPLHFAANTAVAQLLLEAGAELDARDVDHESTPAQYMIGDREEVARFLVGRGAQSDLLLAAALGDLDGVRRHLEADPRCIHQRVTQECFPMSNPRAGGTIYQWTLGRFKSAHDVARERGHGAVFQFLMQRSPASLQLVVACWSGDEALVRRVQAEHPEAARQLTPSERPHLAFAAQQQNADAVRLMLAAGFPLDGRGEHGATALHWAAYNGDLSMVRALLPHRPPLEARDTSFEGTPLDWAKHGGKSAGPGRAEAFEAIIAELERAAEGA